MEAARPLRKDDQADVLRSVFNALAHDLNTPLSCIIGSLETITRFDGTLSIEHRDTLMATALAEAHKLDAAIVDLLQQVKPE